MRDFIQLMAQLFGRRYLLKASMNKTNLEEIIRRSPSMVILPPMNNEAQSVLKKHDAEIRKIFIEYALTYSEQHAEILGPDTSLPLSNKPFSGINTDILHRTSLYNQLKATAIPVKSRSLFVATSGYGDSFPSIEELAATVRRGIYLDTHAIPSLDDIINPRQPLNAYLLDFYIHGQTAALAAANGIRRGDVWYLLQDFDLTLMTIRGVVEQLLLRAAGADGAASDVNTDSGYGTGAASSDLAEVEDEEEQSEESEFRRPLGVGDADWQVYRVIDSALKEFNKKYKAMWA
jgi:ATP-dependent RNA helicase DDX60